MGLSRSLFFVDAEGVGQETLQNHRQAFLTKSTSPAIANVKHQIENDLQELLAVCFDSRHTKCMWHYDVQQRVPGYDPAKSMAAAPQAVTVKDRKPPLPAATTAATTTTVPNTQPQPVLAFVPPTPDNSAQSRKVVVQSTPMLQPAVISAAPIVQPPNTAFATSLPLSAADLSAQSIAQPSAKPSPAFELISQQAPAGKVIVSQPATQLNSKPVLQIKSTASSVREN